MSPNRKRVANLFSCSHSQQLSFRPRIVAGGFSALCAAGLIGYFKENGLLWLRQPAPPHHNLAHPARFPQFTQVCFLHNRNRTALPVALRKQPHIVKTLLARP